MVWIIQAAYVWLTRSAQTVPHSLNPPPVTLQPALGYERMRMTGQLARSNGSSIAVSPHPEVGRRKGVWKTLFFQTIMSLNRRKGEDQREGGADEIYYGPHCCFYMVLGIYFILFVWFFCPLVEPRYNMWKHILALYINIYMNTLKTLWLLCRCWFVWHIILSGPL